MGLVWALGSAFHQNTPVLLLQVLWELLGVREAQTQTSLMLEQDLRSHL